MTLMKWYAVTQMQNLILCKPDSWFVVVNQFLRTFRTTDIGVKNLGELNSEGWYEVCGHKFKSEQKFMEWTSNIDRKLRLQTFVPPLKSVPDGNGGKMKVLCPP